MPDKIEISRELLGVYLGVIDGDWVEAGHELRALLAAPVVERQEPVAYRWRHPANPIYADRKVWEPITLALGNVYLERKARAIANKHRYQEDVYYFAMEIEPLYAEPPAPVAVRLQAQKDADTEFERYWEENKIGILREKVSKSNCKMIWLDGHRASPPSIVLPYRKILPRFDLHPMIYKEAEGYNKALDDISACLDKVKELNQ